MNGRPTYFFSNRVEILYEELKKNLFSAASDPFTKRIVINSSPSMKNWIFQRQAFDFGIASGFEVISSDKAFDLLGNSFFKNENKGGSFPSHLQLTLEIENELRMNYLKYDSLARYLNTKEGFTRKSERRCALLAERLAHLFYQYGKYAGRFVKKWENNHEGDWQGHIWRRLYEKKWNYLYREINNLESWKGSKNFQLHIFAMSYLSSLEINFFDLCAKHIPVNYYLLSPCATYWSDLLSDNERKKILNENSDLKESLEQYYVVENSLLANSGKLGRAMCRQFEERETTSRYLLPQSVEESFVYLDYLGPDIEFENSKNTLTLLESVQADMALLRNPEASEKIVFEKFDHTIQIHESANSRREIEVLHDTILGLIDRHASDDEPICPRDILVMAPEISSYVPFIKQIFSQEGNKLDYQIMDLNPLMQNPLIQGFLHLLSLPQTRWDAVSILELFEHSAFQRKQQLKPEDIQNIKKWIREANVRWGDSAEHREELLFRDYALKAEQGNQGTWSHALDRHLLGLIFKIEGEDFLDLEYDLPLENIGLTEAELLGKWIFLMQSLKEDLKILTKNVLLNPNQWSEILLNLYHKYFSIDSEEYEKEKQLIEQIEAFKFDTGALPFQSIYIHLKNSLKSGHVSYRENQFNAIKFCTLLPMRAIPAKAIILIGLQESNFPKLTRKDSLNVMNGSKECDYVPTQNEYDRFLFLETLLSARKYYIMSYQNQKEGKKQQPSILISELLSYLDKSCEIDEKKPSEICVTSHPYFSYDKENFTKESPIKSYSLINYDAACAFYGQEKRQKFSFIPSFEFAFKEDQREQVTIDIKQLSLCARNPFQTYFNQVLKMYLEKESKREILVDEDFSLSSLERFQIRKHALRNSFDTALTKVEKQGKLPIEPYRSLAFDKLKTEIESLKSTLNKYGITEASFFNIELSDGNFEGESYPPLIIDKVKIVGTISDITPNGLVVDSKDDKNEIIKVWPQFLVYNALIQKHNLPFEKKIIFLKNGKFKEAFFNDPLAQLGKFINYYFKSLASVSPLLPEWIPELLNGDANKWEEKMRSQIQGRFSKFNQDYVLWSLRGNELPNLKHVIEEWKEQASELYSELYEKWYPEK